MKRTPSMAPMLMPAIAPLDKPVLGEVEAGAMVFGGGSADEEGVTEDCVAGIVIATDVEEEA